MPSSHTVARQPQSLRLGLPLPMQPGAGGCAGRTNRRRVLGSVLFVVRVGGGLMFYDRDTFLGSFKLPFQTDFSRSARPNFGRADLFWSARPNYGRADLFWVRLTVYGRADLWWSARPSWSGGRAVGPICGAGRGHQSHPQGSRRPEDNRTEMASLTCGTAAGDHHKSPPANPAGHSVPRVCVAGGNGPEAPG